MRRHKLLQAAVVLVGAFLLFRFGIRPPMPNSVLSLYMAITLMAVLVYVSSDGDSWRAFVTPLWRTLTAPGRRPVRVALGVLLPLLVGYLAYSQAAARVEAPLELRAVHPAPPASINFRGKEINLQAADTPQYDALRPFDVGDQGENPYRLQAELQDSMQNLVGIVRQEAEMQEALSGIQQFSVRAARLGVSGHREYHAGWHTAIDVRNLLAVARRGARHHVSQP